MQNEINRSIAPGYSQPTNLPIQMPEAIELENGIMLYLLADVKDESVKVDIEWNAGSKYQDKKLVANFTNRLLLSGDAVQSSTEIAEKIDFHGGYYQHEMDRDHAGITLFGLRENISAIFEIFKHAFMNCTFPVEEFEKERSVSFARFNIDSKKVKNQCTRVFTKAVFGENSHYGKIATAEDFLTIEQKDILEFYRDYYLNGKPTIFVVGRVGADFIDELRKWSKLMVYQDSGGVKNTFQQSTGKAHVDVTGAVQTAIRMGRLIIDKSHPDYFKFQLLNTILGGYFGSRLMTNIREDKGYTYGIGSAVTIMEDAGYFFITTEVGSAVAEDAIQEINRELDRLRTELISIDELQTVKNYMLGDFLRHADGPIAMMENFKNIHFNKLKASYYTDFIKAVNEATPEDMRLLANKYLQEKDLLTVTAG